MKKPVLLLILLLSSISVCGQSWIRINQMGYLPGSVKVAVYISLNNDALNEFSLCEAVTGKVVFRGKIKEYPGDSWGMKKAGRLDFSGIVRPGGYYLLVNSTRSPYFRIANDVYNGASDYILQYMRQQQCGYNPFLRDSCHTHDGFIVDNPAREGQIIDVKGGWHDATDYLQYVTTSANAVYELLYAWTKNPGIYKDSYDASGNPGMNGKPDILDQAFWGLDWLLRMNPAPGEMYNQVADDRDHIGFRLPVNDPASYGKDNYRPVYYVTGKPQGLAKFKNRTSGVSSTAGKFASAFALASEVLKDKDPAFSEKLLNKAIEAFKFGLSDPGATQTACVVSPYFYEEDNYADDLELAAFQLFKRTGDSAYLSSADYWGTLEPVTPWIEKDTARHYQFYPFMNMGHAGLALSGTKYSGRYIYYMKKGLEIMKNRRVDDPFQVKVPFIWCSNNFVTAALQQHMLYYEATHDSSFLEQEAALRDWLFGCNPWGTSMVIGLPAGGNYPEYPHSSLTVKLGVPTYGGLVDGPVWARIYRSLKGISLLKPDEYPLFQDGKAVYHDDIGDYSTNEPTMDGTACLSFVLSSLESQGRKQELSSSGKITDENGAVIRVNNKEKSVYLIFSADQYGEGAVKILDILGKKGIKGSFFLTGNFLRSETNKAIVKRIIKEGHFIGPHSDRHLLYASWEKRDSLLINRQQFERDLEDNYNELGKLKAPLDGKRYFLAPYEWYNKAISNWTSDMGAELVNLTPGTATNADYTTTDMKAYQSSDLLISKLKAFEADDPAGLNGALVLIHLGAGPGRTDKLFDRLDEIIDYFSRKGYSFSKLQ